MITQTVATVLLVMIGLVFGAFACAAVFGLFLLWSWTRR